MKPTRDEAEPGTLDAMPAGDAEAVPDERARARAYLDLWERHVAQAALLGPAPARRPPA